MAYIKSFIVTLIALSVFLGIIRFLFPKGALGAPLKLICGLIALAALLSPLKDLANGAVGYITPDVGTITESPDGRDFNDTYKMQVIRFAEEGICEDVKAYLLEEYGVRPGNVKARLDGEQSVKSLEITLYGEDDRNAIDEAALKVRYGAQELIIKTNESG
ncbi:MAG: hypothetical protein IKD89_06945 [Clostridia bacterium]|nr:hypothetical protein [Clostridia bacterium]